MIYVDPGGLAVLGADKYDGRIATLESCIVPEELPALRHLMVRALAKYDKYGTYFRVRHDGDIRWAHMQGEIEHDETGRPIRMAGLIRDASAELQHLTQHPGLRADRSHHLGIIEATTLVLSQAVTLQDVTSALTDEELLGPVGAAGVGLFIAEGNRVRRFATKEMLPGFMRDFKFTRRDQQLPSSVALRTQTPLFLSRIDAKSDFPLFWPYMKKTDLTYIAFLPLVAQAQPIGVLGLAYRNKRTCSTQERSVLLTLASTVAQSVQRATLYDREHSIAVGLQKSMLPAVIPSVAGTQIAVRYLPAHIGHRIGGDWYDVSRLPSGRISMTIGDVQGHDVQASAVMGQLRTTMRAYAAEGIAPATLAARASSFLLDLDTDLFATCLYAELDPLTGHVQIIRAGHHNPLIRHRDGATTRPDLQGGLPLGLLSRQDTPYPVNELDLEPADTLLLFTDGLVEFRDTDLDSGMRHLEALLHEDITDPERLADHLIRTLSRGPRQEDDIALLLVSRTGRK